MHSTLASSQGLTTFQHCIPLPLPHPLSHWPTSGSMPPISSFQITHSEGSQVATSTPAKFSSAGILLLIKAIGTECSEVGSFSNISKHFQPLQVMKLSFPKGHNLENFEFNLSWILHCPLTYIDPIIPWFTLNKALHKRGELQVWNHNRTTITMDLNLHKDLAKS